jgi:hypothetical protein
VGKTVGYTRRTRVSQNVEDEAARHEAAARTTCDEGTLHGTYLFSDQGIDENGRSFAAAGYDFYDGNGNIEGVFSHHTQGEVSIRRERYSGTYTVNADCTGTSTFDGTEYDLFIDPGGDRFTWVQSTPRRDPGASGVEERVSRQRLGE